MADTLAPSPPTGATAIRLFVLGEVLIRAVCYLMLVQAIFNAGINGLLLCLGAAVFRVWADKIAAARLVLDASFKK